MFPIAPFNFSYFKEILIRINQKNDLAIISTLGIDYQDKMYKVTIEEEKSSKSNNKEALVILGEGESLDKAIQNAALKINKTLYFIDLDILMISTRAAQKKLNPIMDYITRENNFAFNFNIILADEPTEIIKTLDTKKDIIAGKYIKSIFTAESNSIVDVNYNSFIETYLNGYKNVVLPYITNSEDGITIDKAYAFDQKSNIYLLNMEDVQIYNMVIGEKKAYFFKIKNNDDYLVFKIKNIHTKLIYSNNKIEIKNYIVGSFNEMENINLVSKKNLTKYTKEVEKEINQQMDSLINKCLENGTDPFGFKKVIYNKTRHKPKKINNLTYTIKTDINVDRDGLIFNSVGDAYEKSYK